MGAGGALLHSHWRFVFGVPDRRASEPSDKKKYQKIDENRNEHFCAIDDEFRQFTSHSSREIPGVPQVDLVELCFLNGRRALPVRTFKVELLKGFLPHRDRGCEVFEDPVPSFQEVRR